MASPTDPPRIPREVIDAAIRKQRHDEASDIVMELAYFAACRFDRHGVWEGDDPDAICADYDCGRDHAIDSAIREAGLDPDEYADEIFEGAWAAQDDAACAARVGANGGGGGEEYAQARSYDLAASQPFTPQPLTPQLRESRLRAAPRARERRGAHPGRRSGSRRGASSRSAGGGSPGDPDEGDPEPPEHLALGAWRHTERAAA